MALQGLEAVEAGRHHPDAEVPLARASVADVRGALILYLQVRRPQLPLQQIFDTLRGRQVGAHEACASCTSARDASHAACAIANSANASVRPKNLKLTQARSLR